MCEASTVLADSVGPYEQFEVFALASLFSEYAYRLDHVLLTIDDPLFQGFVALQERLVDLQSPNSIGRRESRRWCH